jgi:hypothetical protein
MAGEFGERERHRESAKNTTPSFGAAKLPTKETKFRQSHTTRGMRLLVVLDQNTFIVMTI